MRILFISSDLLAANLAVLMKQEGHEVKLYIQDRDRRDNLTNLVDKTSSWKKELKWVGKDGLIVFDFVGYGSLQEQLREWGYSVFGGNKEADVFEDDREYAHSIFQKYGLQTVPHLRFDSLDGAIDYINHNPKAWVIKQHSHASKALSYVGQTSDGKDVIAALENYKRVHHYKEYTPLFLQERIDGVEIGVGRYFNGRDWMGPIEMNIEYKKFFPGDLGPNTGEMGTLAWYDDNEKNKLFQETLNKLKSYLRGIDFRGDIDINCIVNENGAFPLEPTPRFGSPIVHLHSELHGSPWAEFLKALADGKQYDLKWKRGFGIVLMVASGPMPYATKIKGVSSKGMQIYFDHMTPEEFTHIHFEEVSAHLSDQDQPEYYVSDSRGFILYVTGVEKSVEAARKKVYGITGRISIPKTFYRNDIGLSFIEKDAAQLKKWGYLNTVES
jgi:phosphoribosylamine--glycine ligase